MLIITASAKELTAVHTMLQTKGAMPTDEVQRLSEYDSNGKSNKTGWQTVRHRHRQSNCGPCQSSVMPLLIAVFAWRLPGH